MEKILARDMVKALSINRNMLNVYIYHATPDEWEFEKEYKKEFSRGRFLFNEQDYKLFYRIRELRKEKKTYKQCKEMVTKEFIKGDEDMGLEHIIDFFSKESNEPTKEDDRLIATPNANIGKEPSTELISLERREGQVLVSSREVAENFEKEHKNVTRDIEGLISSDLSVSQMMIKTTYKDIRNREQLEYFLTRDGFTLLAMGFTGKKALKWKLKYIEAFNKMEKELMSNKSSYMIDDPIERAKAWIKEQQEKEYLKLEVTKQEQIIGELKPRADYTDTILRSTSLVTITQISKDYGMSGQAMNKLLFDLGIQYKQSGQWLLYKDHQGKGYTHSETIQFTKYNGEIGSNMLTKWTQKGRLFLYDLLKEQKVLPLIEQ